MLTLDHVPNLLPGNCVTTGRDTSLSTLLPVQGPALLQKQEIPWAALRAVSEPASLVLLCHYLTASKVLKTTHSNE